MTISAVINTRNEEANITRCLRSLHPYVDEIVIVDMESTDATRTLARKYTNKIFKHKYLEYVEPARNFAISKAKGEWILLLDADEVISEALGLKLRQLAQAQSDYYRVPRKNFIFGKWMQHSGWWPDYQIRFFRKECVSWNNEIHSIPVTVGKGADLSLTEENALTHYHYTSVSQFLERMLRYTTVEVNQLTDSGIRFAWKDLLSKPLDEFVRRFFAWQGYKDGLHGLVLSLLQSFSMLIVYIKLWEKQKYIDETPKEPLVFVEELNFASQAGASTLRYWYYQSKEELQIGVSKVVTKLRSKLKL